MKILLISDIHYIRKLIKDHDLTINLGDLIHDIDAKRDEEQYRNALNLFGDGEHVAHVVGNHDLRYLSREKVSELLGEEKLYYSFDLGGYHHVVLDGTQDKGPGLPYRIDGEQLEWLKQDLHSTELPVLVYCHFPIDNQDMENSFYFSEKPERGIIKNKDEVREILEKSKKVLTVFQGHTHFHHEISINGIKYITAPSFSENDGRGNPKAKCLTVSATDGNIRINTVKVI